jgi:hypothetical protein
MPVLVSVLLQFGAAVFVADLPQRDVASKVELPQNPASPLVHHGDSNAIGVLVYADHVLRGSPNWRGFLEQHEKTVATSHQNACGNPTITHVFQQPSVGSILLDGQTETLMVSSHTEDGVSTFSRLPTEEPFVKSYCWMFDLRSDLASLPSVPLCFLDKLAGYAVGLVLRVEEMVELSVAVGLLTFNRVKCGCCNSLEDAVRVLEFTVLAIRERQKVELQYLLRRYLPKGKISTQPLKVGSCVKLLRNSSPCLKAGVSSR